jgi:ribosomal-protein-alanine N-acetyltransferase
MIDNSPHPALLSLTSGGAADLDAVMEVMNSAFDPQFGEAWTRSQCAGILPMTGVGLRLATSDRNSPVGFSLYRTVAGEAELLLLAVAKPEQGRGVGRKLLEQFIADARSGGATRVHLEVRDNNPAVSMYVAAGFERVGRRSQYYSGKDGTRFDALTLARTL